MTDATFNFSVTETRSYNRMDLNDYPYAIPVITSVNPSIVSPCGEYDISIVGTGFIPGVTRVIAPAGYTITNLVVTPTLITFHLSIACDVTIGTTTITITNDQQTTDGVTVTITVSAACSPWVNITESISGPIVKPGDGFAYRIGYTLLDDTMPIEKLDSDGNIVDTLLLSSTLYMGCLTFDDTYLYVGSRNAIDSDTKVWRILLSDFSTVTTFTFPVYRGRIWALQIVGNWLYVLPELVATLHHGLLYRILVSDFTTYETIDWTDGNIAGNISAFQQFMAVDATAIYIAYQNGTDSVGKYRIAKLLNDVTITFDSYLLVTAPANSNSLSGMAQDTNNVYVVLNEGTIISTISRILKSSLTLSDLNQYTLQAPISGATGLYGLTCVGGYLYTALNNAPTRILKIDATNLSSYEVMSLLAGFGYIVFTDGTEFYIETSYDETGPAGGDKPRLRHLCSFVAD